MGFRTSSKIADDWRQRLEEKGLVPGDEPSIITHYPHLNKYDKMVDPHIKSFTYLAVRRRSSTYRSITRRRCSCRASVR